MYLKAYGYPDVDPIAVIASFSTQGRVKPIYILKNGNTVQVSVREYKNSGTFREFKCDYMIEEDNAVHTIELIFIPDKNLWGTKKRG